MQAEIDNLTFEEWWAELADAVRAWLLRRRVPPHLTDDIVQETGLRLFKMWDEIDAMRSPRGLAFTIASNLLWDERNRRAAREIVGEVPEQSCEDVERAGIARLELARVRRAMSRLSPQQRSVLLAEIGEDDSEPASSADAIKMMRMRARRKLTTLLETSPAGIFVALRFPRRVFKAIRSANRSAPLHIPAMAVIAACTTIAVVGIPPTEASTGTPVEITTVRNVTAHTAAAAAVAAVTPERDPAGSAVGGARRAVASAKTADSHQVHVDFGDQTPVRGGATVSVESTESFEIVPPECSADPTEDGVHVRCGTQVGDKWVEVDTVLGVDP